MGWINRKIIGKAAEALMDGPIEFVRKRPGLFRPDQVGARGAAGENGSPTEERQRVLAVKQEIGKMLRGVPGRCQSSKCQSAKVDLFAIFKSAVRGSEMRGERREDGCSEASQLAAARDEISVEVGLRRERNPQVEPFPELQIGRWISPRVDNQRPTIAERHQV